jgi:hypothetical protein
MTGYLDDSYNNNTLVCGGWIALDDTWDIVQEKWVARIVYEDRISRKHGLKPLTRYHAATCSSLVGEFEGWTQKRQIRFVKRLVQILTSHKALAKPMAFAWGINFSEVRSQFPESPVSHLRELAYAYCVRHCLFQIGEVMREIYSHERITFIHDSGSLFRSALNGFEQAKTDPKVNSGQFVSFAPMDWQDCVLLQAADMVAYDTFKLTNTRLHSNSEAIRKSLEVLVGKGTPIVAGHLETGAFTRFVDDWHRHLADSQNSEL